MTLEERIRRVEERYPKYMTQRQLGEALDLSPSSTYKLLRDGQIPYRKVCIGRRHYHMIHKEDVICYLLNKYVHASDEYRKAGQRCIEMMLWDEPEILTMKDLIRITGLWKNAVQKWIYRGKMPGFYHVHQTKTRKKDLIDFMSSPAYQDSSHANIRARAVTMAVEWYRDVSNQAREGRRHD